MNSLPNWVIPAIVIAAILLILLIVLGVVAASRGRAKQRAHDEHRAAELREKAAQEQHHVQEKELRARESQLEADRARLDADRREQAAQHHNRSAQDSRAKLDEQLAEADRIDPNVPGDGQRGHGHRTDDRRGDDHRVTGAHDGRGFDERQGHEGVRDQHGQSDLRDQREHDGFRDQREHDGFRGQDAAYDHGGVREHDHRGEPRAHEGEPTPDHRGGATAAGSGAYEGHPAGGGLNEGDIRRAPQGQQPGYEQQQVPPCSAEGTGRRRADVDPEQVRFEDERRGDQQF